MNINVIKSKNNYKFEFIAKETMGMPIYKIPSNYYFDYSELFCNRFFNFSKDIEKEQVLLGKNDIKVGDEVFVYSVWYSNMWLIGKVKKIKSSNNDLYVDLGNKSAVYIYFDNERNCWANGTFFKKDIKKLKISSLSC